MTVFSQMLESGYNEPNARAAVFILTPSARSIPAKHLELIAGQERRWGGMIPHPPAQRLYLLWQETPQ